MGKKGHTPPSLLKYIQAERFAGQEDLKATFPCKGLWICQLLNDISLPNLLVLSRKNELHWTDSQLMGVKILFW